MAVSVTWRNGMSNPVVHPAVRFLPRKPVVWWGTAVIYLKDGSRIESAWHSKRRLTIDQARAAMQQVAADLATEVTDEEATDSGFIMSCR